VPTSDDLPALNPDTAALPPAAILAQSPTVSPTTPAAAAEAANRPSVPGYEILTELGRGGMGVVYQARQTKLGRVVALKMILSGAHAGEADLARFRTEAEAIARLQHPNIVQIYEVGEQDALPYFSLEFCAGGSLEKRLKGTPLPPQEAASLVETLARAMTAAHQKGVIHRDLKPANVLLAEDGTPKVTDFGLAKKLDEAGQTATGAVMGTPSYMAPEQAGYKPDAQARAIGPLCDVYALGAILYECLTGRPPFRAATALDTIMQVVSDEPVPPTHLQPKTPRDLETTCLKCLQKEPAKRYASAADLAEELRRFQNGESILARPAGMVERARKWAKRRPAAAALLLVTVFAGLTVVGVVGTAAALVYGKNRELSEANVRLTDERNRAQTAEADAVAAKTDLERANGALRESRDGLEVSAAHSLLRPLGLQGPRPPLADPEADAVWELATTREETLRRRFLAESIRTPATTRQLTNRAAFAVHAAVGLDSRRRDEAEQLLAEQLAAEGTTAEQRKDLALTLAALDGLSPEVASSVAEVLIPALRGTRDAGQLLSISRNLSAVARRMDPAKAAATRTRACAALTDIMRRATSSSPLRPWYWESLSALAEGMEASEAARVAALLTHAMKTTDNPYGLKELAQSLAAVAERMDPGKAAVACGDGAVKLTGAMRKMKEAEASPVLSQGLWALAQGLSAVAERMDPGKAAASCDPAGMILVHALTSTTDPVTLLSLPDALSAVAARMGQDGATQAAAMLTDSIRPTTDRTTLIARLRGLSALAPRMESAKGVTMLTQTMTATKDNTGLMLLANGMRELAPRMGPNEAAGAAATITQTMSRTDDALTVSMLSLALSEVAPRMDPEKAPAVRAEAVTRLTKVKSVTKDVSALQVLSAALAALAGRGGPGKPGGAATDQPEKPAEARAHDAARLVEEMGKHDWDTSLSTRLWTELAAVDSAEQVRRLSALTAALGTAADAHGLLPSLSVLRPELEPPRCRLSDQQLVELLKMPTCVGEARRIVLDQLSNRYRHTFADVWEFVAFAKERRFDLDFTAPPQRPEPAAAR
jgi:hypothetical protein